MTETVSFLDSCNLYEYESMCLLITQSLQRLIIFNEMLNTNSTMRGKHVDVELYLQLKEK